VYGRSSENRPRYRCDVDDRLCWVRLCAGDDSALAEIFDQHGALVLGVARRVTRSAAIAEDVLQDVFTSLWCQPERFDPDRGSLRAYLGVVTQRRAVDALRVAARRLAREERAEMREPRTSDASDSPADVDTVRRAIAQLPTEQRRAVELAFWQGMTHREVARTLGVPEGTVKSRLRLAQAKLRESLAPLVMESV
jgi:RNA polymerase sigma-70 factor (ECF subfamily)